MEAFLAFVQSWGYLAVLLGSLVEGESVILTASSLAYFGHLNIYKVMIVAFLGTLFADQILYMIGRKYKDKIFERFPKLVEPSKRASALLNRFGTLFILSFRFIYGIRVVSPIIVGSLGVEPSKFMPLNFIAAVIWTVISCGLGYYFGDIIFDILQDFDNIIKYIIIACFFLMLGFFIKKKLKDMKK